MSEAENPAVPLLERVRFLSISASNLDEFYSVRVAGLRGLVRAGVRIPSADGLSASDQLRLIDFDARALMMRQQECLLVLRRLMREEGIEILGPSDLKGADLKVMESHFFDQVFPILSPLAIDPAHPFPFIANSGFAMGLQLRREADDTVLEALLPVPARCRASSACRTGRRARSGSCRWRGCSRCSSASCSPATPGWATARSGCCATATSRSRRRPRTSSASSRPR